MLMVAAGIFPFALLWSIFIKERHYLRLRRDCRSGKAEQWTGMLRVERRIRTNSRGENDVSGAVLRGAGAPLDLSSAPAHGIAQAPDEFFGTVEVASNSCELLAIRAADGTTIYDAWTWKTLAHATDAPAPTTLPVQVALPTGTSPPS